VDTYEKKKVLIVDDEPNIRVNIKSLLKSQYDVIEAESGVDAVNIIKGQHFDIAFVDVVMPEMDGIETLRELKELRPDTTVIMMSGFAVEDDIKEAMRIGAFDFLYKPFNKNDIEAIIEKIERKNALSPAPAEYIERKKRRLIPIAPTKKNFQLKYTGIIVLSGLIPILIVGIGFYMVFHMVLNTAQLGRYAQQQLSDIFNWLNLLLGSVIFFSITVLGYAAIHISHKIAGPLYKIEDSIRRIISGEKLEIKIRKEDELQELAKLLNELINTKINK
jgi:CheY-like chemotaxis protein